MQAIKVGTTFGACSLSLRQRMTGVIVEYTSVMQLMGTRAVRASHNTEQQIA
jgi:hypothetical protein